MKTIQINDKDENFIKSLQMQNICLVILGQTSSAKALLVNQLLDRKLFPFDIKNFIKQDNWRFIRIKVSFSYFTLKSKCHHPLIKFKK